MTIVLFALISFYCLREFYSLTPTHPSDHPAMAAAFYIFLPLQYWLVWIDWVTMLTILIPVYAFLALPVLSMLKGVTADYLQRVAKIQWGLMLAVFCISHAPALLMLDLGGVPPVYLLFFLVTIVQLSDVLQYVAGKLVGRTKLAPNVSPSKTRGRAGAAAGSRRPAVGRGAVVDHAVHPARGGGHGAGDRRRRRARRPGAVGGQALARRQGLGRDDPGPWRRARPDGFGDLRRAAVLPPDQLLLRPLKLDSRRSRGQRRRMADDPFALFDDWFAEARASEPNDPEAMAVATTGADAQPSVRMVLLKAHGTDGFVFYTHEQSAKGRDLAENPRGALLFHWKSLRRQIRIEGRDRPGVRRRGRYLFRDPRP